jgi:hypothetical protein
MQYYNDFQAAMDMLVKLKESLTDLSKVEPKCLACASKCDKILQKHKIEKRDAEREDESRKARIEELTSELIRYKESVRGK